MKQTPFYDRHIALGARIVDFAGWQMPIQYPLGIVAEHLNTRRHAGLFDVSHMGRFRVTGSAARDFLRYILTNDCGQLGVGQAQYTIFANENGSAIDDAFLYQPQKGLFLLVVNASNKDKDWAHIQGVWQEGLLGSRAGWGQVGIEDVSEPVAMLALQGPQSEAILRSLVSEGTLPGQGRNTVAKLKMQGMEVCAARTGYTGESVCFEFFVSAEFGPSLWDKLIEAGAFPIGLGARDTLRLEAGLPLYGHELGIGRDGREIPAFAIPQAAFAISFGDAGRDFIGKQALAAQAQVGRRYKQSDFSDTAALPKVVRQIRLLDKGIARDGAIVYYQNRPVGWVTSGTMVPYWELKNKHGQAELDRAARWEDLFTGNHAQRAIGLCMIEPSVPVGAQIEVEVRERRLKATIVKRNLENRKGSAACAVVI